MGKNFESERVPRRVKAAVPAWWNAVVRPLGRVDEARQSREVRVGESRGMFSFAPQVISSQTDASHRVNFSQHKLPRNKNVIFTQTLHQLLLLLVPTTVVDRGRSLSCSTGRPQSQFGSCLPPPARGLTFREHENVGNVDMVRSGSDPDNLLGTVDSPISIASARQSEASEAERLTCLERRGVGSLRTLCQPFHGHP